MNETIPLLIQHGYVLIFAWVLAEQLGLPLPAIPLLFAGGALAGLGQLNFVLAISLAIVAAVMGDLVWYLLGRSRGTRVLKLLCRISLEPDSCVRRTENTFTRYGARSLVVAKFVPGLNTAAPPIAGIFRMPALRFLLFDSLGAFLWALLFLGLGYIFSDQLGPVEDYALRWGTWSLVIVIGSLAAYVFWKYVQRQRFLRRLRIARVNPEEIMKKLAAGDEVMIVDLRQRLDIEAFPYKIPGALHMTVEEIEHRHREIPLDRDIILYCS